MNGGKGEGGMITRMTESRYLIHNVVPAGFFLRDCTTGCEAHSFTTDGYGIFNGRTILGACGTQRILHKS